MHAVDAASSNGWRREARHQVGGDEFWQGGAGRMLRAVLHVEGHHHALIQAGPAPCTPMESGVFLVCWV
jgi:hypothetical protein